ncbi:MAG: DUF1449 family protein [Deltaproteobacteria bacterium]|nr:DUF1449 family protein [Deltaproteobacteria bacterium]
MDTLTLLFVLPIVLAIVLGAGASSGLGDLGDGPDLEVDHDVDGDAHHPVLELLGVGKAPLMVLLSAGLLGFGATGLGVGAISSGWIALVVASVAAPIAMGLLGRFLGRTLPTSESYAVDQDALIGRLGVARLRVEADFGVAQVRDAHGSLHEIRCRAEAPVEAGETLVVVGFDGDRFEVASLEDLDGPSHWA